MKTRHLLIQFALGLGLTLALLWLLGGSLNVAQAQLGTGVIRVATTGTDTPGCGSEITPCQTVQYAVDQAQPGEEIRVAAGTYTGVNNCGGLAQVVYISKTVTIRGGYTTTNWMASNPVVNPTTLDAQGQGRVLYITGSISPTVEGLRITGGNAAGLGGCPWLYDGGGGMFIFAATATIRNCQVFSNTAGNAADSGGGGLYLLESEATLSGNTVFSNTADYGGGLYLASSCATLSGNTVISNVAGSSGGGLFLGWGWYLLGSDATLSQNTVSGNTAGSSGGGLFLSESDATLSGNTVISNTAGSSGGGLYLGASNATLSQNTVSGNTATSDGGGLYLFDSDATLSQNTVSGNTATSDGGGLYLDASNATLSQNTVSGNTAAFDGGGLNLQFSDAALSGNIVFSNTAGFSGGGLILAWTSDATLSGNTVISNTAGSSGGGLCLYYLSNAALSGDTVQGNSATSGGGLAVDYSRPTLTNTIVADNRASSYGSGLYIWRSSSPRLLHTTIARNIGGDGTGVYITDTYSSGFHSTVALTNTILVSHTVGISVTAGNTATLESTLWHGNINNWGGGGIAIHNNDHFGDPAFVAPALGDYHISLASAALDAGVDAGVVNDIDGHHRPYGPAPDLGADEIIYVSVTTDTESTLIYTDTQGSPTVIQVPTGAVTEPTTLVYTPVETATAPFGFAFAGHAFDLDAYRGGSLLPGITFSIPVTVTLHYTDTDVIWLDEASLVLEYWNDSTSAWEDAACGDYDRHPNENWLAVPICHLSEFAMFGKAWQKVYLPLVLRGFP